MRPRCIIFDEASTMLDPEGRRTLLEAMQRLHREGVTVLFITHFMEEAALADRVIVFHRGRLALDGPPEEVFADPARLAALRLDQPPAARLANAFRAAAVDLGLPPMPDGLLTLPALFEAIPPFPVSSLPLEEDQPGGDSLEIGQASPLIEVEGLGYTYMRGTPLAQRALREASLRVAAGEVHGLMGQTGSGKSTLLQHLNGLLRPQEGRVRVAAFNMNDPSVVRREVVRTVGMVFQNPEAQFFEHYVGDEIAFGPEQLIGKSPQAALEVSARVRWAMEQVGLDFVEFKDRPLFTLSGGERRKVALASTLALRPEILLLDEPTAGLDPHSRIDLIEKMALMRDAGMTLVLSSHQMGDMARLAQSVTVFHRGNDVLSGATADVFAQLDSLLDVGLDAPVGAKTAAVMRSKGWMVPDSIIALDDLASWIVEIGRRNAGE